MKKFKTWATSEGSPIIGEKNSKPSVAVPDLSLTTAELIYRFTHGQSLGAPKNARYDSEDAIPFPADWEKYDISEKREWLDEKASEYNELQQKLKVRNNELLEKQRQKEIDEAVAEKMKQIRANRRGDVMEQTIVDDNPNQTKLDL